MKEMLYYRHYHYFVRIIFLVAVVCADNNETTTIFNGVPAVTEDDIGNKINNNFDVILEKPARNSISLSRLTDLCPNFSPTRLVSLNNNNDGVGDYQQPLNAEIALQPERFIGLQEADETVAFFATLRASWTATCDGSSSPPGNFYAYYNDDVLIRKLWHVPIHHLNGAEYSTTTFNSKLPQRTLKIVAKDREFSFEQDNFGVFISICGGDEAATFDFSAFPFDQHECRFIFDINLPEEIAIIKATFLNKSSRQFAASSSSNSKWLVRFVNATRSLVGPTTQQVSFSFIFTRQDVRLVYNLLLPLLMLTCLEIVGLILPPSDFGRPLFAAALLLGIICLRCEIFKEAPPTNNQRIFFYDYLMIETLIGVVATIQAVIMCRVYAWAKYTIHTSLNFGRGCCSCSVKLLKIPDIFSVFLGVFSLIALHFYVFLQFYRV